VYIFLYFSSQIYLITDYYVFTIIVFLNLKLTTDCICLILVLFLYHFFLVAAIKTAIENDHEISSFQLGQTEEKASIMVILCHFFLL